MTLISFGGNAISNSIEANLTEIAHIRFNLQSDMNDRVVLTMLIAFTGPMLLTNMSVWITVGLTAGIKGGNTVSMTAF